MLLDIAKESSDAFPPLKSCLGGINALIKHYDVGSGRTAVNSANGYPPGIQRRERQTRRSHPMVGEVAGEFGESQPRRRSRGGREAITTGEVRIVSGASRLA